MMKIPQSPPHSTILDSAVMQALLIVTGVTVGNRYVHWDKLRRLPTPDGLSSEIWWRALKFYRQTHSRTLPIRDTKGIPFTISLSDIAHEILFEFDRHLTGLGLDDEQLRNPATRDQYVTQSLMEEAITSSQLEGAATTRDVAKELLRSGRRPRNRGEQMIANNYAAMRKIRSIRAEPLTTESVFVLHRILTEGTMDDPSAVGRFRRHDERVVIEDELGQVLHTPPVADELPSRMAAMCDFANGVTPGFFIHPVVRAALLHFWLAYDHPFVDGNGRCARAIFYWSALNAGYWITEYTSISQLIRRAPVKYGRAFLYSETDGNDATYFVLYQLDLLSQALNGLHAYLARKREELREAERSIRRESDHTDAARLEGMNSRQIALLSHALKHPDAIYTIAAHQTSHGTVYQTARTDLLNLVERGLLEARKRGKKFYFFPVYDLLARIRKDD